MLAVAEYPPPALADMVLADHSGGKSFCWSEVDSTMPRVLPVTPRKRAPTPAERVLRRTYKIGVPVGSKAIGETFGALALCRSGIVLVPD